MGIVAGVVFIAAIVALALISDEVRAAWGENRVVVWVVRGALILLVAALVWFLNAFVLSFPNPFDGPHVERLPPSSRRKPSDPHPIQVEHKTLDDAREDHREAVKAWEGSHHP